MTLVFMFPGQSSRYPGMLDKLANLVPGGAQWIERASDLLSWDLAEQFSLDNQEAFARNVDVQVGVFLANHLFSVLLADRGVHASASMGLSLGEYNHLVHIGALGFDDALKAVRARGDAYDAGPRGYMASVQPIELEMLQSVVAAHRHLGVVEVVNLNSPSQHVISGEQVAVEAVCAVLEEEHYVQPVIIERQVPMHSTMFREVAAKFRETLETLEFRTPQLPYMPNRLASPIERPTKEQFCELLESHIYSPVLWRASVDNVCARMPDATFVEVGPMAVLHNLMGKKWIKNRKFALDSRQDTAQHVQTVLASLSSGGSLTGHLAVAS